MSLWQLPPLIKVYEALGAIADKRIEVTGNSAKVYSSSGNKFYTVSYDAKNNAIMCNDNGSYWQGYLGYPSIAYLLHEKIIIYDKVIASWLKNIAWKDVNTKFENNWEKTEHYCQNIVQERGGDKNMLLNEVTRIHNYCKDHPLKILGTKTKPPSGY